MMETMILSKPFVWGPHRFRGEERKDVDGYPSRHVIPIQALECDQSTPIITKPSPTMEARSEVLW